MPCLPPEGYPMTSASFKALYTRFDPFIRFCLVGASGILVNEAALWLVTLAFGEYYKYWAVVPATLVSSTWNFTLTEIWVFRAESQQSSWMWRIVPFFLLNLAT